MLLHITAKVKYCLHNAIRGCHTCGQYAWLV